MERSDDVNKPSLTGILRSRNGSFDSRNTLGWTGILQT
jgi:hypothetical protein